MSEPTFPWAWDGDLESFERVVEGDGRLTKIECRYLLARLRRAERERDELPGKLRTVVGRSIAEWAARQAMNVPQEALATYVLKAMSAALRERRGVKYRKKPVVIEAELFDPIHLDLPFSGHGDPCCLDPAEGQWYILTLEGKLWCTSGDMIIKGVKGEFYPCKPDIFEATYEKVDEGRNP